VVSFGSLHYAYGLDKGADSTSKVDPRLQVFTRNMLRDLIAAPPTADPDTTIVAAPEAVRATTGGLRFESTIAGSAFECRTDDAPTWRSCASNTPLGLNAGRRSLEVRAVAAGRRDSSPAKADLFACTYLGTNGPDTAWGTEGDDVMCGLGGDDVLAGKAGKDLIVGGSGDDVLRGLNGDDELLGGPGNDVLDGGGLNDIVDGGTGADRIMGGSHRDTLIADDGDLDLVVDCGLGIDNVKVDVLDQPTGCETVVLGLL
jgi:hypothetical protein